MYCALFPLQGTQMMKKAVAKGKMLTGARFVTQCGCARIVQQIMYFHPRDMRT